MEVTEVKVFPVQEDRLKAYVSITFDNCFIVRDLKVINGNNGLFVAMPARRERMELTGIQPAPSIMKRGK